MPCPAEPTITRCSRDVVVWPPPSYAEAQFTLLGEISAKECADIGVLSFLLNQRGMYGCILRIVRIAEMSFFVTCSIKLQKLTFNSYQHRNSSLNRNHRAQPRLDTINTSTANNFPNSTSLRPCSSMRNPSRLTQSSATCLHSRSSTLSGMHMSLHHAALHPGFFSFGSSKNLSTHVSSSGSLLPVNSSRYAFRIWAGP
jgi:hypothetical protein